MDELISFDGDLDEAIGWLQQAEERLRDLATSDYKPEVIARMKEALSRFATAYAALHTIREPLVEDIATAKRVQAEEASWEP